MPSSRVFLDGEGATGRPGIQGIPGLPGPLSPEGIAARDAAIAAQAGAEIARDEAYLISLGDAEAALGFAIDNDNSAASLALAAKIRSGAGTVATALSEEYVQIEDLSPLGVWQSYLPVYTNINNISGVYSRYVLIGKTCMVKFKGIYGGVPTGVLRIGLPFPAAAGHPLFRDGIVGVANVTSSANPAGTIHGSAVMGDDSQSLRFLTATGTAVTNDYWNGTLPFVPTTTTTIGFTCSYEIA